MSYSTILYAVDGPIATITLNRPDALNTIVPPMPDEVQDAVTAATLDSAVKVIVVRGAGPRVLRRLRPRRRLSSLGRVHHHRRQMGSGQGLRDGDGAAAVTDPEADEHLAHAASR